MIVSNPDKWGTNGPRTDFRGRVSYFPHQVKKARFGPFWDACVAPVLGYMVICVAWVPTLIAALGAFLILFRYFFAALRLLAFIAHWATGG